MYVFQITKEIRNVGYGYGTPMWVVEFGLGVDYQPVDLAKKLISMGMVENSWVFLRKGMRQKGLGLLVDVLNRISCQAEVEATGGNPTPGWFTKAARWTVWWTGEEVFNFTALRRGQDMLIAPNLQDEKVAQLARSGVVDVGIFTSKELSLDDLLDKRVRVYYYDL